MLLNNFSYQFVYSQLSQSPIFSLAFSPNNNIHDKLLLHILKNSIMKIIVWKKSNIENIAAFHLCILLKKTLFYACNKIIDI